MNAVNHQRKDTYILIPAYKPDHLMIELLINLKKEGFDMFDEMGESMRKEIVESLLNVKIQVVNNHAVAPQRKKLQEYKPQATKKNTEGAIGRNSPCPCGSGKKYKNCCGK